jgi:hypothetical protein
MVVSQVAIVLMSACSDATSGFEAHARSTGPSAAAVEASMFGHEAVNLAATSAQNPWSPAALEAEAAVDEPGAAALAGAEAGPLTSVEAGVALEPVVEQAARVIEAAPRSPRSRRRMDIGNLQSSTDPWSDPTLPAHPWRAAMRHRLDL